jgi:hypothetical protein
VSLFSVMVKEPACTGQCCHDVAAAGSCEQALHLAAGQASGRRMPAGPGAPPGGAGHRGCAGAWGHSLLRCALAEGHGPPHLAAACGCWRPARRVRDGRGLARALPGPGAGPGTRT